MITKQLSVVVLAVALSCCAHVPEDIDECPVLYPDKIEWCEQAVITREDIRIRREQLEYERQNCRWPKVWDRGRCKHASRVLWPRF